MCVPVCQDLNNQTTQPNMNDSCLEMQLFTLIEHMFTLGTVRSGSEHWQRQIAVEVRQGTLGVERGRGEEAKEEKEEKEMV